MRDFESRYKGRQEQPRPWSETDSDVYHSQVPGIKDTAGPDTVVLSPWTGRSMKAWEYAKHVEEQRMLTATHINQHLSDQRLNGAANLGETPLGELIPAQEPPSEPD